jgi:hypothetical protein
MPEGAYDTHTVVDEARRKLSLPASADLRAVCEGLEVLHHGTISLFTDACDAIVRFGYDHCEAYCTAKNLSNIIAAVRKRKPGEGALSAMPGPFLVAALAPRAPVYQANNVRSHTANRHAVSTS